MGMTQRQLAFFLEKHVAGASRHVPLWFAPLSLLYKESLSDSWASDRYLVRCDSCAAPLRWDKWTERQSFSRYTGDVISSFSYRPCIAISHCFYTCGECGELQDHPGYDADSWCDRNEDHWYEEEMDAEMEEVEMGTT